MDTLKNIMKKFFSSPSNRNYRKLIIVSLIYPILLSISSVLANTFQEGQSLFEQGAFAQAIKKWEVALTETNLPTSLQLEVLLHLAQAYLNVGDLTAAETTLQQAKTVADSTGTAAQKILVQSSLGDILLATQQVETAKTLLEETVIAARPLNDPLLLAHVLNNLGNVLYVSEEYSKALTTYEEVASLAQQINNSLLYLQSLSNQVQVHLHLNRPQIGVTLLETALTVARQLPADYEKSFQLLGLGQLALRLEPFSPASHLTAYQIFTEVLKLAESQQNKRLLAYATGFLGELYEREKRFTEAMQLTQQAIFWSQEFLDLLYLWKWQEARLWQAQQNNEKAIEVYQQALAHLHPIRTQLFIGQRNGLEVLEQRIRPVYVGLADLLLQKAATAPTAHAKLTLLIQARETVEKMKVIELQQYYQDSCISAVQAEMTELERGLDAHTAILYPILLPDRTELLLTVPQEGLLQVVVPVGYDSMKQTILEFRKNLQLNTSPRFIDQAAKLYEWLIRPIKSKLTAHEVKTLIVVPDGLLRTIPPAALYDEEKQEFLIHQMALAITPGLTLTALHPLSRNNLTILLNGLSEGVQNFSPLPSVVNEIKSITQFFKQPSILLDKQFLLEQFGQTLKASPYEIIHIASHGQFDRNPKKTFLLAYDNKITMDRLQTLLSFGQERKKPVELLTLSACQTAVGDERAALGLAGVAIKAGARSAIASLWFVNDESTSQLVTEFYRTLTQQPQLSKAEALQVAQQKLAATQDFRHPAYWAPFLLIGNWL